MKNKIVIVILGLLTVSSMAVNVWQHAEQDKQQEQADTLQSEINALSETQVSLDADLETKKDEIDTVTATITDLEATIQTLQVDSESLIAKLEEADELADFEESINSEETQNVFEAWAKELVAQSEKEILLATLDFQESRNVDVTIDYSRPIREQVTELGITYDPSRDAEIADILMLYAPVGDNWHTWNEYDEETGEWTYHYTRADYTDDPLYLAFAKALVKQHDNRIADINQMKAEGTYYYGCPLPRDYSILVYDEIAGIDFSDADREYMLNMLSNLMLDYIESIIGADITWCQQFCSVADTREMSLAGDNYCIHMTPNRAGAAYYER